MRTFITFLFFTLLGLTNFSQNRTNSSSDENYISGYVVYTDGDTVYGEFINYGVHDEVNTTTSAIVPFRPKGGKKTRNLIKSKVYMFKKGNNFYYKKRHKFYAYGGKKTSYLRLRIKGSITLYSINYLGITPVDASTNSWKGEYPSFFYVEKNGELLKVFKKSKKFKKVMSVMVYDNPALKKKIENETYTFSDLKEIIEIYNREN